MAGFLQGPSEGLENERMTARRGKRGIGGLIVLLVILIVLGVVLVVDNGSVDRLIGRACEFVAATLSGRESGASGPVSKNKPAPKAKPVTKAKPAAKPSAKSKPGKPKPTSSANVRPATEAPAHVTDSPGWGVARYALPSGSDTLYTLVSREGRYVVSYDPRTRNSRWAAYVLTRAEVGVKGTTRATTFVTDSRLVHKGWARSSSADYTGSGYDKGHLVPSADRDDNRTENKATFIMTNVSPQKPGLNRYVWKSLEGKVREWAAEHDSLYVVTAGVLVEPKGRPFKKIGSGVAVPELFYKAVATRDGDGFQAIGFVIPNIDDCNRDYRVYAVPVDSIETLTGLDIFYLLPSEPKYDKNFWFR